MQYKSLEWIDQTPQGFLGHTLGCLPGFSHNKSRDLTKKKKIDQTPQGSRELKVLCQGAPWRSVHSCRDLYYIGKAREYYGVSIQWWLAIDVFSNYKITSKIQENSPSISLGILIIIAEEAGSEGRMVRFDRGGDSRGESPRHSWNICLSLALWFLKKQYRKAKTEE